MTASANATANQPRSIPPPRPGVVVHPPSSVLAAGAALHVLFDVLHTNPPAQSFDVAHCFEHTPTLLSQT